MPNFPGGTPPTFPNGWPLNLNDFLRVIGQPLVPGISRLVQPWGAGDASGGGFGGEGFDFSSLAGGGASPVSANQTGFNPLGLDLSFLLGGEGGGGTLSNTLLTLQFLANQQGSNLFSGISIGER